MSTCSHFFCTSSGWSGGGNPGEARPPGSPGSVSCCTPLALLLRWKNSYDLGIGHAPLANFYESLIFFAWAILLLYLIIEWRTRSRSLGAFVIPVAFLLLAFASISPGVSDRIQPLIPALQSNWLTVHVLTCFLGYASFAMAFALGIMYLLKGKGRDGGRRERFSA